MKVLLVGASPETEILARRLGESQGLTKIFCWPAIDGLRETKFPLKDTATVTEVARTADKLKIDLVILTSPEAVQSGLANVLEIYRLKCFGPTRVAAHFQWDGQFLSRYAEDCGIPLTKRQTAFTAPQALTMAEQSLGKDGSVVITVSCASGHSMKFLCRDKTELDHAFDCVEQMESRDHAVNFQLETMIEGPRASFVAFVQGNRTIPVGFVAKSQDFLTSSGSSWQPWEAFAPVSWLPEHLYSKVHRELVDPFVSKLVSEGTPYSGFLTLDVLVGRQRIYLCGARSTPDSLALAALASADTRDWLAVIRFMLGISPIADVEALQPRSFVPTVSIAPPFDISVPPTVASARDLGSARALAMEAFARTYPLGMGADKRLIEQPLWRLARK